MARVKFASLVMLCIITARLSSADGGGPSLPLVYDPQSKKYFISGDAKFLLRPGTNSGTVDRIEIAIDGGDFRLYEDAIRIREEGKHTIRFRAKNPVNLWSPVQITEVFVDLTPPSSEAKLSESTSLRENGIVYASLKSQISLSSTDALSGIGSIEYSWDKTAFAPYVRPIPVEKPGKQTLYFRSVDKVGNVEPAKEMEIVADNTPPASTLDVKGIVKPVSVGGKSVLAVSDSTSLGIGVTDDASGVKKTFISVDGQPPAPYISPIFFLRDGAHVLKYYSEDNVGNREPWKEATLFTITAAPTTSAVPSGKIITSSGVNFAVRDLMVKLVPSESPVGIDRIEFRIDEETEFRPYLEPIRFPGAGSYLLSYRSVDRVGNVEPTRVFSVTIPSQTPETLVSTAQPLIEKDGVLYSPAPNVVTLQSGNSLVGLERIQVSVNDAPFTAYQGPISLTGAHKVYKLSFQAVDKLGNQEPLKTVSYHMVTSTPAVDLFISDEQNGETKMRTDLFDGKPAVPAPGREPASPKKSKLKSKKK